MNPLNPHPLFHHATLVAYEWTGLRIPPGAWPFLAGAIWLATMLIVTRATLCYLDRHAGHRWRD